MEDLGNCEWEKGWEALKVWTAGAPRNVKPFVEVNVTRTRDTYKVGWFDGTKCIIRGKGRTMQDALREATTRFVEEPV